MRGLHLIELVACQVLRAFEHNGTGGRVNPVVVVQPADTAVTGSHLGGEPLCLYGVRNGAAVAISIVYPKLPLLALFKRDPGTLGGSIGGTEFGTIYPAR